MSDDVLDQVSLGYQLYWNAQREPAAVGLAIGTHGVPLTDGPTLLAALQSLWPSKALPLQLAVSSAALLSSLLDYAQPGSPGLILDESQLRDPSMARRVHQAHQRGLALLWRGAPGARPPSSLAPCFSGMLLTLTAQEALAGLQASRLKPKAFDQPWSAPARSSLPSGHLYAEVASRRLVDLCLDELGAWGVAGWPVDEVLDGYGKRLIQPARSVITRLLEAVDADDSSADIDQLLRREPILAYRLLRFANSAGLGLRMPVDSLSCAVKTLGYAQLRAWLREQLPRASSDPDLLPISTAMAVRARLMVQLQSEGAGLCPEEDVYLCGLLSQMDLLLGEPLPAVLARLPLPASVKAALLQQTGPIQAALEIATALESDHTDRTRLLCELHQVEAHTVNQVLLKTLAQTRHQPAKSLLLV
jgi:hypothetical protein